METKTCNKCSLTKEVSEFNKKGLVLQSSCRSCTKEYAKEHYKNNVQYYLTKSNKAKDKVIEWYESVKAASGCSRCPETHPACLDYHHRDPLEKSFNIAKGKTTRSKKALVDEMAKCDILCSNCHRKLHHQER